MMEGKYCRLKKLAVNKICDGGLVAVAVAVAVMVDQQPCVSGHVGIVRELCVLLVPYGTESRSIPSHQGCRSLGNSHLTYGYQTHFILHAWPHPCGSRPMGTGQCVIWERWILLSEHFPVEACNVCEGVGHSSVPHLMYVRYEGSGQKKGSAPPVHRCPLQITRTAYTV